MEKEEDQKENDMWTFWNRATDTLLSNHVERIKYLEQDLVVQQELHSQFKNDPKFQKRIATNLIKLNNRLEKARKEMPKILKKYQSIKKHLILRNSRNI
jgi:hypothetical protein